MQEHKHISDGNQCEDIACPLGCPRNDKTILVGRDLLHGLPGEFTIIKCSTCGLMRTNPRPTRDRMGIYYPDNYGPYQGSRVQVLPTGRRIGSMGIVRSLAKRFFRFNTNLIPSIPPGRMLEIGCASGAFLHHLAMKGWDVEGIEFSGKAAEAARQIGYRVQEGSLEDAHNEEKSFDLVVGWMVLEHLHDPVGGLRKLHQWTKPGAWLAISVPNCASFEFHAFKDRLYALHLPNHLYHFTPQSLEKVLNAGGWQLEKIFHQRILNNLIGSLGYVARDSGFPRLGEKLIAFPGRSGYWPYVLYPLAWVLSLFGQTGRMTVWARKKP